MIKKSGKKKTEPNTYGGAYYTVEATFVVTICVFVLMAILYTGFYVHDKVVLGALPSGYLGLWSRSIEEERCDEGELEEIIEENLKSAFFLFRVGSVSVKSGLLENTVEVNYNYNISIGFLKKILSGKKNTVTYSCESINPAKLKWDAETIDELRS